MNRPVYIYALCEPDQPWNIRYVGKTAKSLTRRLYEHCTVRNLKSHTHKNKWIGALIRDGKKPIIRLIDVGDTLSWEHLEKFYIASYRKAGFDLTNSTDGGEGQFGRRLSEAERQARSKRMMGNSYGSLNKFTSSKLKGLPLSEVHRAKLAASQVGNKKWLGKHHTPETIEKIASGRLGSDNPFYGKTHTEEARQKMSSSGRGRVHSEEHRRKNSEARKEYWRKKREGAEV